VHIVTGDREDRTWRWATGTVSPNMATQENP